MFHNQQLARGRRGHVEFLLHGTMGSELVRERRWVISGFYSTVLKLVLAREAFPDSPAKRTRRSGREGARLDDGRTQASS